LIAKVPKVSKKTKKLLLSQEFSQSFYSSLFLEEKVSYNKENIPVRSTGTHIFLQITPAELLISILQRRKTKQKNDHSSEN
jgi:hypothetical protein